MNDLTVAVTKMDILHLHVGAVRMLWLRRFRQFFHIEKRLNTGLHFGNDSKTFPKLGKVLQGSNDCHREQDAHNQFGKANRTA